MTLEDVYCYPGPAFRLPRRPTHPRGDWLTPHRPESGCSGTQLERGDIHGNATSSGGGPANRPRWNGWPPPSGAVVEVFVTVGRVS